MEKTFGIATWACLNKPNTRFNDDGVWSVDVEINKEEQERLGNMGIKLVEKDDGRVLVKPRRYVLSQNKDGEGRFMRNPKPTVYDKFGNETTLEVGNGSEVEVAFRPFDYKKIKGVGMDLEAVKVNVLVPYSRDAKDVFDFEKEDDVQESPFDD
jgi:hypothetical protein